MTEVFGFGGEEKERGPGRGIVTPTYQTPRGRWMTESELARLKFLAVAPKVYRRVRGECEGGVLGCVLRSTM